MFFHPVVFSDLVKQNSWWSGKWRMHPFSRNGSTMSPAKPAKKLPTPFPMVSSPRANSLSSGVTRRPAAWGECTTIIPASSPIEEQRRIMIHMKGTKWKHDSNKRKTRWAVSKTERGKNVKNEPYILTIDSLMRALWSSPTGHKNWKKIIKVKITQKILCKYRAVTTKLQCPLMPKK